MKNQFRKWCKEIEEFPETAGKWMNYYEVDA
jgi:hypothetical protein